MHPVVSQLVQLQELLLIRDEQKIAVGLDHLGHLDTSIQSMTSKLPGDTRTLFEKLQKKDHIVIAPVADGICAVCGMTLPISLVQAVRLARDIHSCPTCARMLYYPESPARRVGKRPRRSEPRKVGIARFSAETLVIPRLQSTDKPGAITELAYKMEDEGFVDKAEKLVESAMEREAIISTAIGHGLAVPHVRGVEGGGLTLALGISAKGIKWDPSAKKLTRIIFFLVIPTAAAAFYLKLLSGLSETFSKADARKAITSEKDPTKLWKALVKVTRATIK